MGKRGMLTFKGDAAKKKKKKSKHNKKQEESQPESHEQQQQPEASQQEDQVAAASPSATNTNNSPSLILPKQATGLVTCSGTVVTGHGTRLVKELNVGDAIIIGDEMRICKMRLSDISCGISSAFTANIAMQPTKFSIIPKPTNEALDRKKRREKQMKERDEVEMSAFGTYRGSELVYREKTEHGGYRVRKQQVDNSTDASSTTRTQLLSMRAKKTSDKYC